jgi:hypothetical protein
MRLQNGTYGSAAGCCCSLLVGCVCCRVQKSAATGQLEVASQVYEIHAITSDTGKQLAASVCCVATYTTPVGHANSTSESVQHFALYPHCVGHGPHSPPVNQTHQTNGAYTLELLLLLLQAPGCSLLLAPTTSATCQSTPCTRRSSCGTMRWCPSGSVEHDALLQCLVMIALLILAVLSRLSRPATALHSEFFGRLARCSWLSDGGARCPGNGQPYVHWPNTED